MPFTPFHMGAALVLKPAARRCFSLFAFGVAQVVMDIEPLIGMLRGWGDLHGWTHTVLGALLLAPMAVLLTVYVYPWIAAWWNRHMQAHQAPWLGMPLPLRRSAVWAGALVGTLSHVVLDALMHADMRPLAPFSNANPLLWLVDHDDVYRYCALAGALGAAVWLAQLWRQRDKA